MMKMKIIASGIILLIFMSGTLLFVRSSETSQCESPTTVEKSVDFLLSQFNQSLGLCREAPNTASNTYWLVSDNLWAWKALELANESGLSNAAESAATAEAINTSLTNLATYYNLPTDSNGLPTSHTHEAVVGDVAPPPYNTTTNCTLYVDDYVLNTTMLNGTAMSDWANYTDLLLYAALSYHWQGNDSAAAACYNNASKMWNETATGFQDEAVAANGTGLYSTYKRAIFSTTL